MCEKGDTPAKPVGMVKHFSNTVILYSHANKALLTQTGGKKKKKKKSKRQNKIGRGRMKEKEGAIIHGNS